MPEASTERMTSDRVTEGSKSKEDVGMRRPKDTALKQQRMKAWQPILDPWYVIATFVVIGVIFVPVGWRLNQISNDVVEVKLEYDAYDDPNALCGINNTANAGLNCSVTLPISKDMQPPIFLHYEIKNFYQNHKRYEVSRSDSQLLGSTAPLSEREANDCHPLNIVGGVRINPAGLIPNTLFNDVITLSSGDSSEGDPLIMREDGIAWNSDLVYKFRQVDGYRENRCDSCDNCTCDTPEWSCKEPYVEVEVDGSETCYQYYYPNDDTTQYLYETYPMVVSPREGVTNEHFVVWMRVAALSPFRKLYGWIEQPIAAGTNVTFDIKANWEVQSFKGAKSLILSTTSQFGGRNRYLGGFFLIIGAVCLGLAALFGIKQKFRPRYIADKRYLRYKED
mmetsp:Transcript_9704/g.18374  ORF Transcript_9704/g.18374 Transcript_9704/m.18374 type:complete len:393 (-) Transcript_9704:958-2136(-)